MVKARASKYRGVYRCGTKWKAQIQIDGTQYYLGVFDDQEEASEAYKAFARKHGRLYMIEEVPFSKEKTDDSDDSEELEEESTEGKQDVTGEQDEHLIQKVVHVEGLDVNSSLVFDSSSKDEFMPIARKPSLIIPMEKKMKLLFCLKLLKILLGKCIYYSSLNNLHLFMLLSSNEVKNGSKARIQAQSLHLSQCVQLLVNEVLRIVSMTSSQGINSVSNSPLFAMQLSSQMREVFQLHFQSISTHSSCPTSPNKQMKTT